MSRPTLISFVGFGALVLLLLVTAGQPLVTDDAWLHLALGRAFAKAGPWLATDPLLASSPGPPMPTAWLFDVALFSVERASGFAGLRILHVAWVAGIVGLAWSLLRRASGTIWVANLGTGLFITLSAYRLIQLRPHLFTILAALVLYRLLLERDEVPSRTRIASIAILFGVWANVHAAFLLGPLMVGAALAGVGVAMGLGAGRESGHARAISLLITGAVGTVATFLNPSGIKPHLAWFVAGQETPALGRVADEWGGLDLFSLPVPGLPPSGLSWLIFWFLLLIALGVVAYAVRSWRQISDSTHSDSLIDPALLGLSLFSLALPVIAVRFIWLGIFPLLLSARLAGRWLASDPHERTHAPWVGAVASLLVLPAFLWLGPWPMLRATVPSTWAAYRQPYHAGKYHADLIWLIQDMGLRGTAFTEYHMAGFAGFFLAPDVRMLINGTLNVSQDVIAANLPLRVRRGAREHERYVELLDRHQIDLFVGIRLPRIRRSARPWFHTTAHLERTPGWIPVFRGLTGAIYLRANERNRSNLDRVADYYADQGVPFDAITGFDPEQVVHRNRGWAMQHGMIPLHFDQITRGAYGNDPDRRIRAREYLASVYAALGLYERAIELDRPQIELHPQAAAARRRLVWCLLHLRRIDEAVEAAGPLEASPAGHRLSHRIADAALRAAETTDDEALAELVARLPLFGLSEANALTANIMVPAARVPSD